jgi:hypothetical integral membrane protein (TIGR02206 family)
MSDFFASNAPLGAFELFGPVHLLMLGVLAAINLALIFVRRTTHDDQRRRLRYFLAGLLAINELGYHIWLLLTRQWDYHWNLPLHLCSAFVWLSIVMLLFKNQFIFEMAYLLGVGAAIQPLLTSEVGAYGFPHFYAFQIFISHGGIITAALFMAIVEGMRPTGASLKRVILWGNLYLVLVTMINFLLDSNYLYTHHKPHIPTLLDALGPWPWYILAMEAIAIAISLVLYLPFWLHDRRSNLLSPNSYP